MPGHKTHKVIGVATAIIVGVALTYYLNLGEWKTFALGIGAAFVFSFLPDLDTPASIARKIFWIVAMFFIIGGTILGNYFQVIFTALVGLAIIFTKHRGWFHRWPTPFLVALPILIYTSSLVYAMAVSSYLSHIVLDRVVTKIKREL